MMSSSTSPSGAALSSEKNGAGKARRAPPAPPREREHNAPPAARPEERPEERLARFARLAAQLLDLPMAQLSLLEGKELRAKAGYEIPSSQRLRAAPQCQRALNADEGVVEKHLENAASEDRPLRFYAGAPLVTPGGRRLGVLSVFDTEPRRLDDADRRALAALADTVVEALAPPVRAPASAAPPLRDAPEDDRFTDALIDSLPGIFYLFNMEGQILRWNDRFETLTGYTADEIRQMGPLHFVAPDGRGEASRALTKLVDIGRYAAEVPFQTKDGRRVPVFCTGCRVVIDGETRLVGMGTDLSERKRALQALRASESRYERLVEDAPMPMIVHREGRFLYANPAAAGLAGADDPAQLVGRSLFDFVHPDFHEAVRERVAAVYEGRKAEPFEAKLTRLDGQGIEAKLVGLPISYEGAPASLSIVRDVTERKRAEEALRTSERLYRRLFERANVPVMIFHPENERILEANPAARRLYGFEREDFVGRSLQDLTRDVERGRREVQNILEHGGTRNFETVHRTHDGTPLNLLASCSLIEYDGEQAILLFARNITERKRAEAETERLKAFYETILDEVPVEIAALDAEGRYQYVNRESIADPALREWMIGKTDLDYARRRGGDAELYRERYEWTLGLIENKEAGRREEVFRTDSDEPMHLLRVEVPVLTPDDDVEYVVGYSIDLTEHKKYERELVEAKEEAEEMARVKSVFLANMSHEIRTPLSTIGGFAEVLAEESDREHHREFARTIERVSTRLDATLTSILDLARLESDGFDLELSPLDITAQLEADLELFAAQAQKKGLAFHIEAPDAPVRAAADEMALSRVLANLVSNALKFTDEGYVRIRVRAAGGDACIEIDDSGVGIDEAFLPTLFDDFTQESHRTGTGSGLGLSITKRLVELMNGRISVASREDEGTTFTVTLPLAQGEELGV